MKTRKIERKQDPAMHGGRAYWVYDGMSFASREEAEVPRNKDLATEALR